MIYYTEYEKTGDKWQVAPISEGDYDLTPMNEVVKLQAYIEVYAVTVRASSHSDAIERAEALIHQHNNCQRKDFGIMNRYSVRYCVRKDTPTWDVSKLHPKTTTGSMNQVSDYVSNNKMLHMFLEAENELQALEKATNEFKKHLARQWRKDFGQL